MAMEFWGVEVKSGEPLKVKQEEGTILHLSQASLGEVKKGNDTVLLSVNIDGKKTVLGTLSADKFPQISYDLVFEKDFELSHTGKNGSVYFCGYRAETEEESDSEMFESGSEFEEEETPVAPVENGKPEAKAGKSKASVDKVKTAKPDSPAAKSKVKDAKPVIDEDEDSSDDDDDDDSEDDEDVSGSEDLPSESEDGDDDSSDEEDEATPTPKNAKQSKKRPAESVTKTPAPEKKAKLVTPQKSGGDGKKGSTHTATPHPSKTGKSNADKSKQQTPKSAGQVICKSCSKTFNSDGALQSHTKAKHSDAK